MNISMIPFPLFPGKSWEIMKSRKFFLQFFQFIIIKQVLFFTGAKNQVNIL